MSVRRRHKVDKKSPRSIVIQRRSLTLESHTRSSSRLGIRCRQNLPRSNLAISDRQSIASRYTPIQTLPRSNLAISDRLSTASRYTPIQNLPRSNLAVSDRQCVWVHASQIYLGGSVRYGPIHGHWSSTSRCTEITRHLGRSPQRRDIPLLFLWEHRHTSPRPFNIISNAATRQ